MITTKTEFMEWLSEYIPEESWRELWLDTPNRQFDNETPRSLLEHGEMEPLISMANEIMFVYM